MNFRQFEFLSIEPTTIWLLQCYNGFDICGSINLIEEGLMGKICTFLLADLSLDLSLDTIMIT